MSIFFTKNYFLSHYNLIFHKSFLDYFKGEILWKIILNQKKGILTS